MSHRRPLPQDDMEARSHDKLRHLQSVRFAAQQRELSQADRPRFALLRRIVRAIRGGGD